MFEQKVVDGLAALDPALKSAAKGANAAKRAGKALAEGDVKNVGKPLAEAQSELAGAAQSISAFIDYWQAQGIEAYFQSDAYFEELLTSIESARVDCHQLDQVLYVYPAVVRLVAEALAVRIDKKLEYKVRPSKLAAILSGIQKRPSRFPVGRFLRSLFRVYKALASSNLKRSERWTGRSLFLRDIYEIMSAAPGSDYSEQEFVRDVYLLDASGEVLEVSGHMATLEASSGTRDPRKVLSIITRDGQKRLYSTIRFDPVTR